ncbi:hypothetical protein V6Z92_008891 [Aspergillus fumigatus]
MMPGVEFLAGTRMQQNTCASPGPDNHLLIGNARLFPYRSYSYYSFIFLFTTGSHLNLPVKILLFMIGFFDSAGDWPGSPSLPLPNIPPAVRSNLPEWTSLSLLSQDQ